MRIHPFFKSAGRSLMVVGIVVAVLVVHCALLVFYAQAGVLSALTDSIVSVGMLLVFCYLLWYIVVFVRNVQTDLILTAVVLLLWLVVSFAGKYAGENISGGVSCSFGETLPFRLLGGGALWVIVLQWYRLARLKNWKEERLVAEQMEAMQPQAEEIADRIAVKDGARIHIIPVDELIYVQASGDYVMLYAATGQYLKEQTMKFFESHLPSSRFVRVHRSYIVNVEQIVRVELFGKETYQVLLKNGVKIRASQAGYKLLKDILAL